MVKIRDLEVCTSKKKSIEIINLGLLACMDHGQTSEVCVSFLLLFCFTPLKLYAE